jgi:hypothetical protein
MPSSGHQASGRAMKIPEPSYSDALNSGMGSLDRVSRSLRSPSAADLIPSATSVSASRNSTDPAFGPASSSVSRSFIAHLRRCTASATTARTSRRLVMPRTTSATARAGITYRTGPASQIFSGIRVVRCSLTNPVSRRCLAAGTRTSTISVTSVRMSWLRSAAGPVTRLPSPAYSSAAISCCRVVGAPVAAMYTPGSSPRHGPPGRSRCRRAWFVRPTASAWAREITLSCRSRIRSRASRSHRVDGATTL